VRRKSWIGLGAAALLLAAVAIAHAFDNARWGANYFPNIELTTQDGRKVKFYDDLVRGKIVAIDLMYTTCVDACPLETARLAQVQRMLGDRVGKDIFFYSITIDPQHDTPEVLKAYAEKYHAGPGWYFLTGKKEEIEMLSKKLGLYTPPDPNDRDGHRPSVLLGNEPAGQWVRNAATDNPRFLSLMITNFLNAGNGAAAPKDAKDAPKNYADAAPLDLSDQGRYLFATHCAACHTIGHGDTIGPDLQGITRSRDHDWLVRFIVRPDKMLVEGDPLAKMLFEKYKQVQMPNLKLSDAEALMLVNFLDASGGSQHDQHQHHDHDHSARSGGNSAR
jgi:protein SCO1/2